MNTTPNGSIYTARAGETWDSIAYLNYAEERMASEIIRANPRLCHIVVFEGGEQVLIPVVSRVKTPDTLPPWRR